MAHPGNPFVEHWGTCCPTRLYFSRSCGRLFTKSTRHHNISTSIYGPKNAHTLNWCRHPFLSKG